MFGDTDVTCIRGEKIGVLIKLIFANPYRILGLSITATDREIAKRVSDLSVYAEMGKAVNYDYDFVDFAPLERNIESIKDASSKLEQPKDKLLYTLFWLSYNSNKNLLKELTIDNLSEVIDKFPNNSVYDIHNKAILSLLKKNDPEKLKIGIGYFEEFFNHPNINQFFNEIIGDGISNNYNLEDIFTVELINELNGKYVATEIFELFQDTKQKQNVLSKLTKPLINNIESEIDETRIKTTKSKINANEHCRKLIARTYSSMRNLKSMLQESDIRFTNISNKLVNQILNSTIAYFNSNTKINSQAAAKNSINLIRCAKKYIFNNKSLLERANKNISTIKNWLRSPSDIGKEDEGKIEIDPIEYIENQIATTKGKTEGFVFDYEEFFHLTENLLNEKNKFQLKLVSEIMGSDNPLYIELSSKLANVVLDVLIIYFNHIKKKVDFDRKKRNKISKLLAEINTLDLDEKTTERTEKIFIKIKGFERFNTYENSQTNQGKTEDDVYRGGFTNSSKTSDSFHKNHGIPRDSDSIYNSRYSNRTRGYNKKATIGCSAIILVFLILLAIYYLHNDFKNIKSSETEKYSSEKNLIKIKEKVSIPEVVDMSSSEKNEADVQTESASEISKFKGNQLLNGSSPYDTYFGNGIYDRGCLNEITFKNGYNTDAIVCLVDFLSDKIIRNEYIQKNKNYKMKNLPNGTYYLKVFSGNDWNPHKHMANGKLLGGFETSTSFSISNDHEDLMVIKDNGYEYTIGSVTLYNVEHGNMKSEPISEKDFFK